MFLFFIFYSILFFVIFYIYFQLSIFQVKRFAEAFFVIDNPRPSASGCYDSNYQNYVLVSEAVRRSRYFNLLPPLAIECTEVRVTAVILMAYISLFIILDFYLIN